MKKLQTLIIILTLGMGVMAQTTYKITDITTDTDNWKDIGGTAFIKDEIIKLKYLGHNVTVHTHIESYEEFIDDDGNNVAMWACDVKDNGKALEEMVFGIIYKGNNLAFIMISKRKEDPFYILFNLAPDDTLETSRL